MQVVSTDDWREYDASVAGFLERDPIGNTVALTVLDALRHGGAHGDEPPWFTWALVLGRAHRERELPGAIGPEPAVRAFAEAAGREVEVRMSEVQYVLHALAEPPPVAGDARPFSEDDLEVYVLWMEGFLAETGLVRADPVRSLRTRLAAGGGLTLWWVGSDPVAMAGRSRAVAGVPRIGPVWTPPEHRGRGYAAAVTGHVCRESFAAGARACTLFADAANPTSNGVYVRLGFAPVGTVVEATFRR